MAASDHRLTIADHYMATSAGLMALKNDYTATTSCHIDTAYQ